MSVLSACIFETQLKGAAFSTYSSRFAVLVVRAIFKSTALSSDWRLFLRYVCSQAFALLTYSTLCFQIFVPSLLSIDCSRPVTVPGENFLWRFLRLQCKVSNIPAWIYSIPHVLFYSCKTWSGTCHFLVHAADAWYITNATPPNVLNVTIWAPRAYRYFSVHPGHVSFCFSISNSTDYIGSLLVTKATFPFLYKM